MREKLIKLIHYCTSCEECRDEDIADHIIASSFIEELQNEAYDLGVDSALHNHFGLSWEDAAGLRKEIRRIQDASRWIPVSEPPKKNGYYLCWILFSAVGERKEYRQKILFWEDNIWLESARSFSKAYPLYWMRLPEPPKEGCA